MELVTLRGAGLEMLVDLATAVPSIVHWGPSEPGEVSGTDPSDLARLLDRPAAPAGLDRDPAVTLVPTAADGFRGRPGLEAHLAGTATPIALASRSVEISPAGDVLSFRSTGSGVEVTGEVRLDQVAVLSLRVVNLGDRDLHLQRLAVCLPLPPDADELERFDGRWCREFHPTRSAWSGGVQCIETRTGRTGHDHIPAAFCGPTGFGEHHGTVHAVHVAWSGNSEIRFERLADGTRIVTAGELLVPGEIVLAPGEEHRSPDVIAATAVGLTATSRRLHRHVRSFVPPSARPVSLNTWEAVYFDHDLTRLTALADVAASVGVERFVLDDGWFGGRRDDTAGLGDWFVSPDAHPRGLGPLIDHVEALGMQFGIWVEPEMVNPDSDLHRAHPEWVLGDPTVTGRGQLVLDLSIDACWNDLLGQLDRLLSEHSIGYVKWDHNRDLAGAGAHRQTRRLYDLIDALRERHPGVEFESCASGGGRADFGILARTNRIWTSDCNDALERQTIQRGFSRLFPPEVMGAHIGPGRAHTTGREQRLAFRAATAMFGHLGIEWNLLEASERHRDALRWWIALHKDLRPLLHAGDVIRLDPVDGSAVTHGVISPDRTRALLCHAKLTTAAATMAPRIVLRGLDPHRSYAVRHLAAPGEIYGFARRPQWMIDGATATGRDLMTIGLQMPLLQPESAVLIDVSAAPPPGPQDQPIS